MDLENRVVYGPVHSRRFGWDLGVNLLPLKCKLCTFDCVYCQYGFTPPFQNQYDFPTASKIILEWQRQLAHSEVTGIRVAHTTISGNGEPTMHPGFHQIIPKLVEWRDENAPQIRLAVLSNGYRLHDQAVLETMRCIDEPILKLDSAIPEKFQKINRPLLPFPLSRYLQDLQKCGDVIIQTMFIKDWNDQQEDVIAWRNALIHVRPRSVQIYTISRDTADPDVHPISDRALLKIAEDTTGLIGVPVHAYL